MEDMTKRKKNAIWGRYPCCDLVNNAIRDILNGNSDVAINELLTAIIKAGGYVHEDIAEETIDRMPTLEASEMNQE